MVKAGGEDSDFARGSDDEEVGWGELGEMVDSFVFDFLDCFDLHRFEFDCEDSAKARTHHDLVVDHCSTRKLGVLTQLTQVQITSDNYIFLHAPESYCLVAECYKPLFVTSVEQE